MTRALPVCAVLLALPIAGLAQEKAPPTFVPEAVALGPTEGLASPAQEKAPSTATVIRLKVQPAPAPRPALRYQLLPELSEMEPGNAILGYLKCFMEQNPFFFGKEAEEKREKWANLPLKDLPLKEMRADGYRKDAVVFRRADAAARLDHADWQTLPSLRREGINLLLPEVQQLRLLAWALLTRFRADVAERKFDDALVTAKTLLGMARHMGDHPTLIGDLVGIAMATMAFGSLEEMLQQPGCPNLYWALTDLPDPLIGLRPGLQGERIFLSKEFAALDDQRPMTEPQLQHAVDLIGSLMRDLSQYDANLPPPQRDPRGWLTARAGDEAHLRGARQRLVAYGLPRKRVQQFSPLQVVLLDEKLTFEIQRDEATKALTLPYWQAAKTIAAGQPTKASRSESLFGSLVAVVSKVRLAQARIQQRIGLLRCVEALRVYAAEHEGRLPARLEDISVPVPVDPVTGRPFLYSLDGPTATVRGSPPAGMEKNAAYNVRYEVTIAK